MDGGKMERPGLEIKPIKNGWKVVNCPYDSVTLIRGYEIQILTRRFEEMILNSGQFPCVGNYCAIYPCERVRGFAEGVFDDDS